MAQLLSVSWSSNGVAFSGSSYVNAGDTITITYTFDSSPGMRGGDRISLSNGEYATFVSRSGNNATFTYTVGSGSTNSTNLTQTTTTIVPGDRTSPQTGFTYAVSSSAPSTPIVLDTIAPAPPTITGISPDTDPLDDHITASTSVTITGTAEANNTITIFRDSVEIGTTTADGAGAWSFTDPTVLTDGANYNYTARSADPAGNLGGTSSPYGVEVDTAVCFLAGTLIRTPTGETPVERLAIGDLVLSADGRAVPVKWLGRQTLSAIFTPAGRGAVRIAEGALGANLPARDLKLTADHALLVDGLLVQAGALIDGTTIRPMTAAETGERYTVWHIETEGHEVILAEGCPAETFVDNVGRRRFDNYAEYEALYGDQQPTGELDLPRIKSARQLPAALRRRIQAPRAA